MTAKCLFSINGPRPAALTGAVVATALMLAVRPSGESLAGTGVPDLRDAVRGASNAVELHGAFGRFFASGAVIDDEELRHDADLTIAIRGAWERVRESVPPRRRGRPQELREPSVTELHRFLGFLEARLRTTIPRWWEEVILGTVTDGDSVWQTRSREPGVFEPTPYPADLLPDYADRKLPITAHFELASVGDKLHVKKILGGEEEGPSVRKAKDPQIRPKVCPPPDKLVEKLGSDYGLACYMDSQHCVLAQPSLLRASKYDLICIDMSNSSVLWKSAVWACAPVRPSAWGGSAHVVAVTVQEDSVTVFGRDSFSFYVERFAIDDGTNRLRFSSSY
jgi:hypothetical protein